jgi:hypothetical protein
VNARRLPWHLFCGWLGIVLYLLGAWWFIVKTAMEGL